MGNVESRKRILKGEGDCDWYVVAFYAANATKLNSGGRTNVSRRWRPVAITLGAL